MRRLLSIFVGLILWAGPVTALAQDADREARLALAERAVAAMQGEQMSEMVQQMTMAFPPTEFDTMSGAEQIAFEEVMAEVNATMMMRVLDGTAVIYADIFTRAELEAMVGFYESEIGQSILQKTYAATPEMIELVRGMLPEMMRDVINGMCDRLGCTTEERAQGIREALSALGMTAS